MKIKKYLNKFVIFLLLGILIPVSLFPFSISADTLTSSNINGISVTLQDVSFIENVQYTIDGGTLTVQRNFYTYMAEVQLDNYYLGNVKIEYHYNYTSRTSSGYTNYQQTKVANIYINGNKGYFTFSFIANSSIDPLNSSSYYYINESNVTLFSDLDSVDQIINILNDLYNDTDTISGLSSDQLTELQNIVANTSLANTYLLTITQLRQWHIPIESFVFNYFLFNSGYTISDIITYNYWDYPIFNVPANSYIDYRWINPDQDYYFILGVNKAISSTLDLNLNFTVSSGNMIFDEIISTTLNFNFVKFHVVNIDNGYFAITPNTNIKLIGVLSMRSDYYNRKNFSTDYALVWNLSNKLLDNIQLIANGSSSSNSSSSSLDSTTSNFSSNANDLVTIEDSFNSSLNSNLQNINPVFNLGSSFLVSANWVSTQFNNIVNNTPFASLITFGLTLGLALLLVGKVRK